MDMMRRELDLAQLRISDLHVDLGEARRKLKMAIDEISLRERQRVELSSLVESTEEECLYAQERAARAEEQLRQAGLPVGLRMDGERVALDSMLAIRPEAAPATADSGPPAGGASNVPSAAAAAAPAEAAPAPAAARRDSRRKSSGHGVIAGAIEMFRSRTQGATWFHREPTATALGKSPEEARAAATAATTTAAAAVAGPAVVRATEGSQRRARWRVPRRCVGCAHVSRPTRPTPRPSRPVPMRSRPQPPPLPRPPRPCQAALRPQPPPPPPSAPSRRHWSWAAVPTARAYHRHRCW